jgi:hydrogenase maturation protein HypF
MAPLGVLLEHAAPTSDELELLQSAAAPIVLLQKCGQPLPDILAPRQSMLGWMLPYTPLHHILFDHLENIGVGPLVMTSGNLSGEPQVIGKTKPSKSSHASPMPS